VNFKPGHRARKQASTKSGCCPN